MLVNASIHTQDRLSAFLHANVPEFPRNAVLEVRQFQHGQSNPTYLLRALSSSGAPAKLYVLRKKPPGKVLSSAHAVEREHAVLAALAGTAVPVPRVLCLCTDAAVIGTPFYVMEHVKVSALLALDHLCRCTISCPGCVGKPAYT